MVQLSQLVDRIDSAFGGDMPFTDRALTEADIETLNRIFSDAGYRRYLQDQVNRQIIRDYLTNAAMLNLIDDEQLETLTLRAGSIEGRSELSLYMLMSSVEQAGNLPLGPATEPLKPLHGRDGGPPHLNLIRS